MKSVFLPFFLLLSTLQRIRCAYNGESNEAKTNALCRNVNDLLYRAVRNRDAVKVEEFIGLGANVNLTMNFSRGLLHLKELTAPIADCLVRNNANINMQDDELNTPLHHACLHKQPAFIRQLVALKANVNAMNLRKQTPLSTATIHSSSAMAKILLECGAAVSHLNSLEMQLLQELFPCIDNVGLILSSLKASAQQPNSLKKIDFTPWITKFRSHYSDVEKRKRYLKFFRACLVPDIYDKVLEESTRNALIKILIGEAANIADLAHILIKIFTKHLASEQLGQRQNELGFHYWKRLFHLAKEYFEAEPSSLSPQTKLAFGEIFGNLDKRWLGRISHALPTIVEFFDFVDLKDASLPEQAARYRKFQYRLLYHYQFAIAAYLEVDVRFFITYQEIAKQS